MWPNWCTQLTSLSWKPKAVAKEVLFKYWQLVVSFFKYMKCYGKMWLVSLMWWTETLCISEISAGFKHWRWKIGEKKCDNVLYTELCYNKSFNETVNQGWSQQSFISMHFEFNANQFCDMIWNRVDSNLETMTLKIYREHNRDGKQWQVYCWVETL